MRWIRGERRGTAFGSTLATVLTVACLAWGAGPLTQPLVGQGLAEFDYENLAPRGIMPNVGWVRPGSVNPTGSIGLRLDLGYLGPGVRITTGFSQWSSTLRRSEVAVLEDQLADLVEAQTGTRPVVDLGRITWSDVALNADAHVVWRVPGGLLTYAGAGGTAHLMRGGGTAIEGTFVQDLLNTIRAGANLHGGIEVPLGEMLRVVGEGRVELVQSVTYAQIRAGLQYTWGPSAPGERP